MKRIKTLDELNTFDANTVQNAGAFLVNELEKMDQTLHEPMSNVTWNRDIQLRSDVTMADEASSFTNSSFGAPPNGKAWIGKDQNAIEGIQLDIAKTSQPLSLWGMQLGWTLPELASAQKLGRPIDTQKYSGMQMRYNFDIDEMVYVGDETLSINGLFNQDTSDLGADGDATHGGWDSSTDPDDILEDVNNLLNEVWEACGFASCPTELRLPPRVFGLLVTRRIGDNSSMNIREYLANNSLSNAVNGTPLNIEPVKWLSDITEGGRMVAYTNREDFVRFPLVPLQRTPMEYRDLRQLVTYYGRLGAVETVYPNTIGYADKVDGQ